MSTSVVVALMLGAAGVLVLVWVHAGRRVARVAACWTLVGVGLGAFAAIALPALFGGQTLTVMSGSMEPAIHVGDVVIDSRVAPERVRVGDIVTFRDPEGGSQLITHRVRRVEIVEGRARFATKGDNSNSVERWTMPVDGSVGRVEYRLPRLGYLVFWLHGPLGRLGLIAIPAIVLAGLELWRIWRPQRPTGLGNAAT